MLLDIISLALPTMSPAYFHTMTW